MRAIVLSGGSGSRMWPVTKAVSKQLLPVYDKVMCYYPISVLMLSGIRDILIITTPQDKDNFVRLLGDGKNFGINFTYAVQPSPDGLAQAFVIAEECGFLTNNEPCVLILGDNIFHGPDFTKKLLDAKENANNGLATIFSVPVKLSDASRYGIAEVDKDGKVISIEEKPEKPKSNLCVTGLYFYPAGVVEVAKSIKPSKRGELEITSVNQKYLEEGRLRMENLGTGFAWLDTGTFDSLSDACGYVEAIEKRTGQQIACLEEIAYRNGWITNVELLMSAETMIKNEYGKYLYDLATQTPQKLPN